MKRAAISIGCLLFLAVGSMTGAPFSQSLSNEQLRSSGLDRLSSEERQRLDELIELYQEDRLEQVTAAMDAEVEKARADAAIAAAAVLEIEVAEARRAAEVETAAAMEVELAAARKQAAAEATQEMEVQLAQVKEEAKVEAVKEVKEQQAAEKRFVAAIVGDFRGWSGRTQFKLDNGQIWIQKKDSVYTVARDTEAVVVIEDEGFKQYRMIYTKTGAAVPVTRIQ